MGFAGRKGKAYETPTELPGGRVQWMNAEDAEKHLAEDGFVAPESAPVNYCLRRRVGVLEEGKVMADIGTQKRRIDWTRHEKQHLDKTVRYERVALRDVSESRPLPCEDWARRFFGLPATCA